MPLPATISVTSDSGIFRATLDTLSATGHTPYEAIGLLASRAAEAAYFEAKTEPVKAPAAPAAAPAAHEDPHV